MKTLNNSLMTEINFLKTIFMQSTYEKTRMFLSFSTLLHLPLKVENKNNKSYISVLFAIIHYETSQNK